MSDIIVTTPKSQSAIAAEEAEQVKAHGGGFYFRYFRPGSAPKDISEGNRVFYVEDGFVRGYGVVSRVEYLQGQRCDTTGREWPAGTYVYIDAASWKWIRPLPMKGFQGWRYSQLAEGEIEVVGGWLDPKP